MADQSNVQPSDLARLKVELATGIAAYTDEGRGRVIVAIHGLPGSSRDFRWLAPRLAPGARVIRVDLPGFGETPALTGPDLSPDGRARYVLALMDALELHRPLLLGHSMGGVVACAAAALAPERIRGLALVASPGLRPHAMLRRVPFGVLSRLLALPVIGQALSPVIRWLFASGGFRGYPDRELYHTLQCVAHTSISEHAARVRRVTTPTLVAWCDDDPIIPGDIAQELAAACPAGPRLCFPTGGHNPQKSRADELAAALLDLVHHEHIE